MKTSALVLVALTFVPVATGGQAGDPLLARVKQERGAYLKTLQELVAIESGSRDSDGLNRISELIAGRLRALGGDVQFVAPGADVRFDDTPKQIGRMVLARFKGTGTRRVLLLAHMDTVYEKRDGREAALPRRWRSRLRARHRRRQAGRRADPARAGGAPSDEVRRSPRLPC